MNIALFAYGTLQNPQVMFQVTGRFFSSIPVRLEGYACYSLKGRSFPGIRKEPDKITQGLLYSEIGPATLAKLDLFEDDFYVRSTVEVIAETGERIAAEAYVIAEQHYALLDETPWDLERFTAHGLKRFLKDRHIFSNNSA